MRGTSRKKTETKGGGGGKEEEEKRREKKERKPLSVYLYELLARLFAALCVDHTTS